MAIEIIREVLGWCAVINIGLLLWWFLVILVARDWIYHFHSRWFQISVERFNAIHYAGIALFKIAIFFFNVVPYFALRIVG